MAQQVIALLEQELVDNLPIDLPPPVAGRRRLRQAVLTRGIREGRA